MSDTITPDDISLTFIGQGNIPLHGEEVAGYEFEDFFREGMDWARQTYQDAAHALHAAQATYTGRDCDGIGVRVTVWDGDARIVRVLTEPGA
jgi:hypothetical protein